MLSGGAVEEKLLLSKNVQLVQGLLAKPLFSFPEQFYLGPQRLYAWTCFISGDFI